MTFGKTIKIFLLEGDPKGRLTCELSNWTGKAYKIPRTLVANSVDRAELFSTGVYLLFGQTEDGRDSFYVGEAESIILRLKDHLAKKEFWVECIAFINKGEGLNKAQAKYLETRMYDLAVKAGRCELDNSSTPAKTTVTESDKAEMEEFLANARLLVRTLGHKVFDAIEESSNTPGQQSPLVYIKGARNAVAKGQRTSEGFMVLKDSKASMETMPSFPSSLISMRERLLESGTLKEVDGTFVFSQNHVFGSPSAAAMVVLGRPSNGLGEWKDERGVTLKRLEADIAK